MSTNKLANKERILNAAQSRFIRYGFQKTNITEIADDCKMSPANLYRFFKNKAEIGAAVVQRHLEHTAKLSNEVLRSEKTAKEKLFDFTFGSLEYNYGIFTDKFHLFELIQFISQKRSDLPKKHIKLKKEIIVEILSEGQGNGEITSGLVTRQAELLFQALRTYLLPHSLIAGAPPLEELKRDLTELIELLFEGLRAR